MYRIVTIPVWLSEQRKFKQLCFTETEWSYLGIRMSVGWMHYDSRIIPSYHPNNPERVLNHGLKMRKIIGTDRQTGMIPDDWCEPQDHPDLLEGLTFKEYLALPE